MEPQTTQTKPYNLEPHVEAALSYLFGAISGVFVLIFEKQNKFVRFHAVQSILFNIAALVLATLAGSLLVLAVVAVPLVTIGATVLWVFLMWKAYNKEEYQLPVLGKIAKDFANK